MRKWIFRIVVIVITVLVLGSAAFIITWSNPAQPAANALAAMQSTPNVTVTDQSDQIIFMPKTPPKTGLVFYPGARVAPAAYAEIMHALAEKGYAVFIVKMPINFALLGINRAGDILSANPTITNWVVGGHSLGGTAAAQYAGSSKTLKALILYASYPASDMSARTDLAVLSIFADHDGLATPAKIAAAKAMLPAATTYVEIKGGIHAYFGDYGPQDGDGQPATSHADQTAQTIAATLSLLDQISA